MDRVATDPDQYPPLEAIALEDRVCDFLHPHQHLWRYYLAALPIRARMPSLRQRDL